MKKLVLLSAALLLLVFLGTSAQSDNYTPFTVKVIAAPDKTRTYSTYTAKGGSLFGGLIRLKYSNKGFDFQYIPYDDYGPYLYSVNHLAGDSSYYWRLLSGTTALDGMGCYFPKDNEEITLKYTKIPQDHLKSHSDL